MVTVSCLICVLVGAHVGVRNHRHGNGRSGSVVDLEPTDPSSYEGSSLQVQPSLIWVGDSQTFLLAAPERNGFHRLPGNDSLVNRAAEDLDARYPTSTPRTYLRLAAPAFGQLEATVSLAVWLQRAHPPPVPVVLGISILDPSGAPPLRPATVDALQRHPDDLNEVLTTIAKLPEGKPIAQRASMKARIDDKTLERWLNAWASREGYYYGDPQTTILTPLIRYQKAEEPVLQTLFGRVQQEQVEPTDPTMGEFRFLRTFVAFLKTREMPVICYAAPWNPNTVAPSDLTRQLAAKLRTTASAAGCMFIDASEAVPAAVTNWGFSRGGPDPNHLSAEGAKVLADFIVAEGAKINAWSALERESNEGAPR